MLTLRNDEATLTFKYPTVPQDRSVPFSGHVSFDRHQIHLICWSTGKRHDAHHFQAPRYRGLFADQFSDQLEILAGRGRVQSGAPIRFDHFLDGPGDRFAAQKGILQLDLPVWTSNRIFQPAAHAHLSKKFQRRFTWIMSI
jgi:hypothetical protein